MIRRALGNRALHGSMAAITALAMLAGGCRRAAPAPPAMVALPPRVPQEQLSPPVTQPVQSLPIPIPTPSAEKHVDIDTHGREIDVREALQFLADEGGLKLVFSPEINKKIRLRLVDVSVSQALETVLSVAGLTLESTVSATPPRQSASIVFYELPVNVDSLSAESIMKRFGVSRTIADLIVQARTTKP